MERLTQRVHEERDARLSETERLVEHRSIFAGRERRHDRLHRHHDFIGDSHDTPLDGIRVLELGQLIAGPFAGRMLAEFGADVLKVGPGRRPAAQMAAAA